jgi:RND superfamily putative drug exporter
MATFLHRIGEFAVRRRWFVLVAWLVILGVVGGGALAFKGTMTNSFTIPGTEAQQALDQLQREIPASGGAIGQVVFAAPDGKQITDYAAPMTTTMDEIEALGPEAGVVAVVGPIASKAISPDRQAAIGRVMFSRQLSEIDPATQDAIAQIAERNATDGLQIELGGGAVKQAPSIGSTEAIGVVVALIVLLITFGSMIAAGMTMLTALIGVGVGLAGILWASGAVQMSSTAPILALMLGLAVGIDYALFVVSRHRHQLVEGVAMDASIARAVGTAGSAVTFAGATVFIALAGLSVVGIPFLTVMGLGAAGTVLIAVLIALTLLPALLKFAGYRVLRKKDREPAIAAAAADEHVGAIDYTKRAGRWIRGIARFPALVAVAVIAVMGVLSIPAFKIDLALPDDGTKAPDTTARQAYDIVTEHFGPGVNGPLVVTVTGDPADLQNDVNQLIGQLSSMPNVQAAVPGAVSQDGTLAVVQVIPKTGPSDPATEDLVNDIRAAAPAFQAATGATVAVTGQTALAIDVSEKLGQALPIYLAIVVGLALILLLLVFRSLLVPVIAAAGFLLSIGVAAGAVVAVYQWGWFSSIFGVDTPAPIISFLPIILTGVLFGLAMDYQVFTVSGMREAHVHGANAKDSVVGGFTAGARVVVAAAIIMTSVFAGFILAPDAIIASIGFALGLGVLIDAFLVRMTLVPAIMTLLGTSAWYLPKWLDKILPNVDIEGAKLLEQLDPASTGKHGRPDDVASGDVAAGTGRHVAPDPDPAPDPA